MVAAEQLIKQRPVNALLQRDSVKLAPPVLPSTILCAGSNYREHNDEKAGSRQAAKSQSFF
jgi:2-keto-4-pentenoate hydratase/2-oxohepta-3-ene-1,7-dioic acid hydratase in catechol pathway